MLSTTHGGLAKRLLGFSLIAAIATLGTEHAYATPLLSGPVVNAANGHTYYLLQADTWTNSEAAAVALGGHLATVRNMDEDLWIYNTFSGFGGGAHALWIGLTDEASGGVWVDALGQQNGTFYWTSGEAVSFTNWSTGQPNNVWNPTTPTEMYAHMWAPGGYGNAPDGSWNDYVNGTSLDGVAPLNGVVEIIADAGAEAVPEPTSLALLGGGLTAMIGFLRKRKAA